MRFPLSGRSIVDIKCTEQILSEFPQLLFFGDIIDKGVYFDATKFFQNTNSIESVDGFLTTYDYMIAQIQSEYEVPNEDVCCVNSDGHMLIHSSLIILFLSFAVEGFLSHVCERVFELFTNGFTVSDSMLESISADRFHNIPERTVKI